jgi:hypothetical protein
MKQKHIKLFESFDEDNTNVYRDSYEKGLPPFSNTVDLPEGYSLDTFKTDPQSLKAHFESLEYYQEAYGSFDAWVKSLSQMGVVEYPSNDGRPFYRGMIKWPEWGIEIIYELHPF